MSCASADNCRAGGILPKTGAAVTAGEARGTWGRARANADVASLLKGGDSVFTQVSCTAAGQCTAGYQAKSVEEELFLGAREALSGQASSVAPGGARGGSPIVTAVEA